MRVVGRLLLFCAAASAAASQTFVDANTLLARAQEYVGGTEAVPEEILKQLQKLRTEIDTLHKTLSSRAPVIHTPCAFQWAQNATHVLLHVKFTRRWNAPGALQVANLNVAFTPQGLSLTGEGEHSGNRYLYSLSLNLFSEISPDTARHNFASVGRLMIHIPKKTPSLRWPRLLADATLKPDYMHFWMDMHQRYSDQLDQLPLVAQSPLTCATSFYCPTSDACVAECSAALCAAKPLPPADADASAVCVGPPTDAATPQVVSFVDVDPEVAFIRGDLKVNVTASAADEVTGLRVYFGDADKRKLAGASEIHEHRFGEAISVVTLPISAFVPSADALNLLVVLFNQHGEAAKLASLAFRDFVAPPKPAKLEVTAGHVSVSLAPDFAKHNVTAVTVVFGKLDGCVRSKTIAANLTLDSAAVQAGYQLPPGTRAPASATHILAFSRTSLGDSVECVGFALSPTTRSAPKATLADFTWDSATSRLTATSDKHPVEDFVVYAEKTGDQRSRKLGELAGGEFLAIDDAEVRQICMFARNYLGESEEGQCLQLTHDQKTNSEL